MMSGDATAAPTTEVAGEPEVVPVSGGGDASMPGGGDASMPGSGDASMPGGGDASMPVAGDSSMPGVGLTEAVGENGAGLKRSASNASVGSKKKKAKVSTMPKSPLMLLNELAPGSPFSVELVGGPDHNPQYTAVVTVKGQGYTGVGTSKQKAKQNAATVALKTAFLQFTDPSLVSQVLGDGCKQENVDFAQDEPTGLLGDFSASIGQNIPFGSGVMAAPSAKRQRSVEGKHPVMALNELCDDLSYALVSDSGQSHDKVFVMSVTAQGQTFEGSGRNKKIARGRAAQRAVEALYDIQLSVETAAGVGPSHASPPDQALADRVANVVYKQHAHLVDGVDAQYTKRKVLAGIVLTTDKACEEPTVISVTTGTKCINGEFISREGEALNDCHAEVLARRCLVRVLMQHVRAALMSGDSFIVMRSPAGSPKPFMLRPEVRFHLFISSAPCGDGRLFSPHETSVDSQDPHPNRKARGRLRTKIESGEGTVLISETGVTQTWDGVLVGNRLLTMSCSDKLLRWNVLGVQGSLMSTLLPPVYFSSVVLGSLYHGEHLKRALCGRAAGLSDLPQGFALAEPLLTVVTSPESRHPGKAPSHSLNWSCIDEVVEIVSTTKGRLMARVATRPGETGTKETRAAEGVSRLCKRKMFEEFKRVERETRETLGGPELPAAYDAAKDVSTDYQGAKAAFFAFLKESALGSWVQKPAEQDQF